MRIPGTEELETTKLTMVESCYNKGEILKVGISGVEVEDSYIVTDKLRDTEFTIVSLNDLSVAINHYRFLKKYNLV